MYSGSYRSVLLALLSLEIFWCILFYFLCLVLFLFSAGPTSTCTRVPTSQYCVHYSLWKYSIIFVSYFILFIVFSFWFCFEGHQPVCVLGLRCFFGLILRHLSFFFFFFNYHILLWWHTVGPLGQPVHVLGLLPVSIACLAVFGNILFCCILFYLLH